MTISPEQPAADRSLYSVAEVGAMIAAGDALLLAGEEQLLAALPQGRWIGGTIPYFMTHEDGGTFDRDRIFVQRLPDMAAVHAQHLLPADALSTLADGGPDNGFTVILLPSQSPAHQAFALRSGEWPGVFRRPLVGWVTGAALDRLDTDSPKVFDGATGQISGTDAVVMHVALPDSHYADVDIVNLFEPGDGPALTFGNDDGADTGFTVEHVHVDGVRTRLVDYIADHGIDTRLPLVADYNGAMINVATAGIAADTGHVTFFAPVFSHITYRFAKPIGDYETLFAEQLGERHDTLAFACNCILNYNYAGLAGKRTADVAGPMSFGEIAYMLLTQTLVYLTIKAV